MATFTSTQLKTRLNTKLRDSADRTFTSSEKDEFYTTACEDEYVYKIAQDTSLTVVAGSFSYAMPTGFTEVTDFGFDANGDGSVYYLDRNDWEVIDGNIILYRMVTGLPTGATITVVGKQKLTDSDVIPDYLTSYLLELCLIEAFEELKTSLTTRFLKNDISMSEIIANIGTHERKAARLRASLPNRRAIAG